VEGVFSEVPQSPDPIQQDEAMGRICAMNAIATEGRGMKILLVGAVGVLTLQVLLF
jgi:hypothetical protein